MSACACVCVHVFVFGGGSRPEQERSSHTQCTVKSTRRPVRLLENTPRLPVWLGFIPGYNWDQGLLQAPQGRSRFPFLLRPTLQLCWDPTPSRLLRCLTHQSFLSFLLLTEPFLLALTFAYISPMLKQTFLPHPPGPSSHCLSPPIPSQISQNDSHTFNFLTSLSVTERTLAKVTNNFQVTKSKGHYFRPRVSAVFKQIASPTLKRHLALVSRSPHCWFTSSLAALLSLFHQLLLFYSLLQCWTSPWLRLRPPLYFVVSPWVSPACGTPVVNSLLCNNDPSICVSTPDLTSDARLTPTHTYSPVCRRFTVVIQCWICNDLSTPNTLIFFQFSFHSPYTQLQRHPIWDLSLPRSINHEGLSVQVLTNLESTLCSRFYCQLPDLGHRHLLAGLLWWAPVFLLSLLPPSEPFSSHQQEIHFQNENLSVSVRSGWRESRET